MAALSDDVRAACLATVLPIFAEPRLSVPEKAMLGALALLQRMTRELLAEQEIIRSHPDLDRSRFAALAREHKELCARLLEMVEETAPNSTQRPKK